MSTSSSAPIAIASSSSQPSSSSSMSTSASSASSSSSWDRFLSPFSEGTHPFCKEERLDSEGVLSYASVSSSASSPMGSRRSSFGFEFGPSKLSQSTTGATTGLLSRLLQQQQQPMQPQKGKTFDPSQDPRLLAIFH